MMGVLIVWLMGVYCGALLTWIVRIVMDIQRDREWKREHLESE